jgi:serine/threonine-protein kinase
VTDSRFLPGAVLANRYRIIALLGKGGMGEVYRADDLTLGQPVALKFLPEAIAGNENAVARFRNEVRTARQVSHPNVCRVYDVGTIDGHLFLSMEYVDGEDLDSLLRRIGRLPSDKALEIARRLCAGLAAAHEKGVLHRDLKPSNVMLDGRGQVLLADFGLAGLAEQIEGADIRNGTPAYMAPEQLAGKEVTVKSDLYSLGLVLYEIFTGKRPFEANTLAELVRAQSEATPVSPSSLVRDLDPVVERVILRCLDPEPARRPASALAVAAALPGGDPLAAALAAGETPSPEMVAAAGHGYALAHRIAIPLLVAVLAGIAASAFISYRYGALSRIPITYSPEVLSLRASHIMQRLGYTSQDNDNAWGFDWDIASLSYADANDKPFPGWNAVLGQRPSPLRFWYRESKYPLVGERFHDDRLTPAMVSLNDPPPILSGMIHLQLDAQGRLMSFEAIPDQIQEPAKQSPTVDWSPLFTAAELDQSKLQTTEPLRTWLATSDTRAAWTGTWPGTNNVLRVEAAVFRGKPVAFAATGPWDQPSRMPPPEPHLREQLVDIILIGVGVIMCVVAPMFARKNLRQGRGDRRGAARLAVFIFVVQMAIWLCRAHFGSFVSTSAMFFVALATSLFYGAVVWAIYLALEPYVRRRWPQTLISWSSVLTGHVRDPIVGRDILFGIALGVCWRLIGRGGDVVALGSRAFPWGPPTDSMLGLRQMLGAVLLHVPGSVRNTLAFFFLLFLLRVILRNQWLASAAFILIILPTNVLNSSQPLVDGTEGFLVYSLAVLAVLRMGLLPLGIAFFVEGMLSSVPITIHPSDWYFNSTVFMLGSIVALATWAFFTATAGQRLWKQDWFD